MARLAINLCASAVWTRWARRLRQLRYQAPGLASKIDVLSDEAMAGEAYCNAACMAALKTARAPDVSCWSALLVAPSLRGTR